MPESGTCTICGGRSLEQTAEGWYCTSCQRTVPHLKRTVHHELLPHEEHDEEEGQK